MDIKQVLAAFGIKSSLAIGIIGACYLIGITEVANGQTMPQMMHEHFIKPTPFGIAMNDRIHVQKFVMGVEYQLDKHKAKLRDIQKKHQGRTSSVDFQIEFEEWKTEERKLQKQFDYWLKRSRQNQSLVDTMIAGTT